MRAKHIQHANLTELWKWWKKERRRRREIHVKGEMIFNKLTKSEPFNSNSIWNRKIDTHNTKKKKKKIHNIKRLTSKLTCFVNHAKQHTQKRYIVINGEYNKVCMWYVEKFNVYLFCNEPLNELYYNDHTLFLPFLVNFVCVYVVLHSIKLARHFHLNKYFTNSVWNLSGFCSIYHATFNDENEKQKRICHYFNWSIQKIE